VVKGGRTELADKGCRSPHHRGSEIAEKAGGGNVGGRCSEATVLEGEAAGKSFRASDDRGGIYEAQAAAESGESVVSGQ